MVSTVQTRECLFKVFVSPFIFSRNDFVAMLLWEPESLETCKPSEQDWPRILDVICDVVENWDRNDRESIFSSISRSSFGNATLLQLMNTSLPSLFKNKS